MNDIIVFSTPYCQRCPGTKQRLLRAGLEFIEVNAITNAALANQYGVKSVPSVVVLDEIGDGWKTYTSETLGELISER